MIRAEVSIKYIEGFDASIVEVLDAVDENLEEVAEEIYASAKNSIDFKDKTGNLRRSIKLRKSKFGIHGGYIIVARGKNTSSKERGFHAHLVERGHVMVRDEKIVGSGWVSGTRFLRKAKEKGLIKAVQLFRNSR